MGQQSQQPPRPALDSIVSPGQCSVPPALFSLSRPSAGLNQRPHGLNLLTNCSDCTPVPVGAGRAGSPGDTSVALVSLVPRPSPSPAPGPLLLSATSWHMSPLVTSWHLSPLVTSRNVPTLGHTLSPRSWVRLLPLPKLGTSPELLCIPDLASVTTTQSPGSRHRVFLGHFFVQHQHRVIFREASLSIWWPQSDRSPKHLFPGWPRWLLLFKSRSVAQDGIPKDMCLSCPSRPTVCRQPPVQNKDRVLMNSFIISILLRRPLPPAAVSE